MHHMSTPRFGAVFSQASAHRLGRQAVVLGKLDHNVSQTPASSRPRGGLAQRLQVISKAFSLPVSLRSAPGGGLAQRPLQIAFHEAPLGPVRGGTADRHGKGNLLIAAAGGRPPVGGTAPAIKASPKNKGQYLAFICAYSRNFRRPPAEGDMQRHFRVSPPPVRQWSSPSRKPASSGASQVSLAALLRKTCRS
jgi:hypothetical protein